MKQKYQWNELNLGTCYYPEHWDRSLWKDDLRRMKENGIFTVRIGEFAWNLIEPVEGVFQFDFFDEFLDLALAEGMKVIYGTPTATPPVWLTEKYPECLNCDINGNKYYHGMRRHYTYNAPKYQELCARIVEQIAAHYAPHPAIIGWQIDNELNCETDEFYSASDSVAFREFLKKKYGSLENLNRAWATIVWNQTYTQWDEIFVPRKTIHNSTNPHQVLDFSRFISDSAIRFCKMQSDIIRKYIKPGDFVTTNGMFENLDNHAMTDQCLDVYTYDSYPNFPFCLDAEPEKNNDLLDRKWSLNLAEVRSISPHFGIMEQQSGANGWNTRMEAPAPKPGQLLLWAMQSIAHGADYVSFFRWRTATVGTEMYWHGILDYDNRDNRKLKEVHEVWDKIQKIQETAGATWKAAFALVRDYDNIWDARVDRWHQGLAKKSEREIWYTSQVTHTPMDICYINDETTLDALKEYPMLIYPHPLLINETRLALLKAYVEQGGTLILGARAGQKDMEAHCPMTPMPGLFREISAAQVDDFTFLSGVDEPVYVRVSDAEAISAGLFQDVLAVTEGGTARGTYEGCEDLYYKGQPGLVETQVGEGRVLQFGGTFNRENMPWFLQETGVVSPWEGVLKLPKDCELTVKEKDGKRYYFVLNYSRKQQTIQVLSEVTDMESKEVVKGQIVLKPFDSKIYTTVYK